MKVTFFKVLALFAVFSPLTAITGKCKARKPTEWSFSDEQEAAIARLKLLMEKLSSIKRSYPAMYAEKRGKLSTFWPDSPLPLGDINDAKAADLNNYMNILDGMRY